MGNVQEDRVDYYAYDGCSSSTGSHCGDNIQNEERRPDSGLNDVHDQECERPQLVSCQ